MSPAEPADRVLTGRELGSRLCETLGLDPNTTGQIVIDVHGADVVRVTIEQLGHDRLARALVDTLGDYELHRRRRQLSDGFTIQDTP